MTSAQSALINEELIGALNALRTKHVDQWGQELDHVRFRARGLRKFPTDLLAIQAMIAVLEGSKEGVLASAEAIEKHPEELDSRLNILRSLSALHLKAEAVAFAHALFKDFPTWHVLAVSGGCLFSIGAIEAAQELLAPWAADVLPDQKDADRAEVVRLHQMAESYRLSGVTGVELARFLTTCRATLVAEGWPTADMEISQPVLGGQGSPLSIITFYIDVRGDIDVLLGMEEKMMDALSSNPLYQGHVIIVGFLSHNSNA